MQARLGLVVLIAAACGNDADKSPTPRLFTEEEIAGYEAALTARLAESAKRRCVRPVVREPGTDTAATPDLIALAEPAEPIATCLKTFRELSNQPGMKMTQLVESRHPKLVELDASCGDALEQLVRARTSSRNTRGSLRNAARRRSHSRCSPHADAMNGERDFFDLYHAMPLLHGKSWVPPGGGWPEGMGPRGSDAKKATSTKRTMSPRDEAAIMLAASEQMAKDRDRACPATATLKACHDGMLALADAVSKLDAKEVEETLWAELIKAAKTGDATAIGHRIRTSMINIVTSIGHPPLSKYTGKRAGGYARLAAFRVHLEVLRAGHCPSEAELAAPPYPALLVPTALGDALRITRLESGDLEVAPPAWGDTKKPSYRISCKLP